MRCYLTFQALDAPICDGVIVSLHQTWTTAVANYYYCSPLVAKISGMQFIFLGDEAANSNDSNWSMDCSTVLRVKTLHISSPILAAKSPFFYKVIFHYFV